MSTNHDRAGSDPYCAICGLHEEFFRYTPLCIGKLALEGSAAPQAELEPDRSQNCEVCGNHFTECLCPEIPDVEPEPKIRKMAGYGPHGWHAWNYDCDERGCEPFVEPAPEEPSGREA